MNDIMISMYLFPFLKHSIKNLIIAQFFRQICFSSFFPALQDLFRRDEFSSRPPFIPSCELRTGHDFPELEGRIPGIIFSKGKYWKVRSVIKRLTILFELFFFLGQSPFCFEELARLWLWKVKYGGHAQ